MRDNNKHYYFLILSVLETTGGMKLNECRWIVSEFKSFFPVVHGGQIYYLVYEIKVLLIIIIDISFLAVFAYYFNIRWENQ